MTTPAERPEHPHYQARWTWARYVMMLTDVGAAAKILAQAIAYFVNRKTGTAWPSQTKLAGHCGVTTRQIRNSLTALIRGGLINNRRPGGGKVENRTVGRSGEFELLRVEEAKAAIAALDQSEGGKNLPVATINPEMNDAEPGNQLPDVGSDLHDARKNTSDNLHTNLHSTNTADLHADNVGYLKIDGKDHAIFESVDYSSIAVEAQHLSEEIISPSTEADGMPSRIAMAAARLMGYSLGKSSPPKIDGLYPDAWAMSKIPKPALAQMVRRCRAGRLSLAELALVLHAVGVLPAGRCERSNAA